MNRSVREQLGLKDVFEHYHGDPYMYLRLTKELSHELYVAREAESKQRGSAEREREL